MKNIELDSFVAIKKELKDVQKNSIGVVSALNGKYAMILFIGVNKIERIAFEDLEVVDIEKTGKGYDIKICNICHILKNSEEFSKNQNDSKGNSISRPSCKDCRKAIDGKSLSTEAKKRLDKIKPKKTSIFICPICHKRSIVDITVKIVRDHDHDTGMEREWICDSCNTGLGRFKDNPKYLQQAIDYLNKYEQ